MNRVCDKVIVFAKFKEMSWNIYSENCKETCPNLNEMTLQSYKNSFKHVDRRNAGNLNSSLYRCLDKKYGVN